MVAFFGGIYYKYIYIYKIIYNIIYIGAVIIQE